MPLKTESKLLSNSSLQQLCDIDQTVNTKDTTGEPLPHDKHMGGFLTGLGLIHSITDGVFSHPLKGLVTTWSFAGNAIV